MNQIEYANIIFTETRKSELIKIFEQDFASSGKIIYFPFNLDVLRNCDFHPKTKLLADIATKNFIDGIGISILIFSKYKNRFPRRITGSDIFNACLEFTNQHSLRIALLGSTAAVLQDACMKIKKTLPNINFCFSYSPSYPFEITSSENDDIVHSLNQSKADIVFIFLGNPKQELWIVNNYEKISAKIFIPLGATLNFFSGNKKRAPKSLRYIGLEWVWRLCLEPKRLFKRYILIGFPFLLKTIIKNLINRPQQNNL